MSLLWTVKSQWSDIIIEMSSFWWNFHHWLHRKLSFWQLLVQPAMEISSTWRHFRYSGCFFCTKQQTCLRIVELLHASTLCERAVWHLQAVLSANGCPRVDLNHSPHQAKMSYMWHNTEIIDVVKARSYITTLNSLRPRQKAYNLQTKFSNSFSWMKMLYFDANFSEVCS